jgi:hypothetical protein
MKGHTLDCTSEVFRRMGTGWCLCKSIHRLTTAFLGCSSIPWRWQETMALEDSQEAHGKKHTTHLSSGQDYEYRTLKGVRNIFVPHLDFIICSLYTFINL